MAAVSYVTGGTNDLERAKTFYDGLLGSIGMRGVHEPAQGGRLYAGRGTGMFGVLTPHDGGKAIVGNGVMGGFSFDTAEEVAAFHAKALELGGTDEGAPGPRGATAYFAYFRDPDGNKLCGYKLG